MDDLFVKRPAGSDVGSRISSQGSQAGYDSRAAARMVQEMRDIVLDEARDAVSLSPDEQRLRGAGKSAPRREDDSWDEALGEVEETGFIEPGDAPTAPADAEEPIVEGLFARRRENAPGQEPAPQGRGVVEVNRSMADDLFGKRKNQPEVSSDDLGDAEDDEDAEDDGEDDDGERAANGQATEGKRQRCQICIRCCSTCCCCSCCRRCVPSCDFLYAERQWPDRRTIAKYGGACAFVASLLALATVALAMGCDVAAPLGSFCVSEGPVQWMIAALPVGIVATALIVYLRRILRVKHVAKQESWEHDADAQRSAAELLDTLAVAPPADRHKYAAQAVQVLRDFPDKAVIQHKGCAALEAICRAQRGNVQNVHAAGAVPTILQALETHLRVRKVQTSGLSVLACMAKVSKKQIFELGGIETILKSMAKFKRDPAVQVSGSMALGALCLNSVQNRKSIARFGGVSVLVQALERHVERADVIIAASETLTLIGHDSTGVQKQMLAAVGVVQGIAERYESAKSAGGQGGKHEKKARDCEIVLRSLRKLEGRLAELAEVDEEDAASDVATPRLHANQEGQQAVQVNHQQANELMGRLHEWKK